MQWQDFAAALPGAVAVLAAIWRAFRALDRQLAAIRPLADEVHGLRKDLTTHMAEEERHLDAEMAERRDRQAKQDKRLDKMDGRLGRIEDRVTVLAEARP